MSILKYETQCKEILQRTPDVKSFRFPRPPELDFKAGQFLIITIKDGSEDITRHFTISSSPTERGYIEFTKRLTGSRLSNILDTLQPGAWARLNAAFGKFTYEGEFQKLGMLTGGIGVTPMRSICKYCTDTKLKTDIAMLCSCHSSDDILFKEDFEEMQKQNKSLKVSYTLTDSFENWGGITGRIDAQMIKQEIPDYADRIFYISGPPHMVDAMVNVLKTLGLPNEHIKTELFSGYQ